MRNERACRMVLRLTLAGTLLLGGAAVAEEKKEEKKESTTPAVSASGEQGSTKSGQEAGAGLSSAAGKRAEYVPPSRGAPGVREGGGTRGPAPAGSGEESAPTVIALIPENHAGLTTREQPVLYWYLSAPTTRPIEFTLNRESQEKPMLERSLSGPLEAGIHAIRLSDVGVRLEPGERYTWYVTVVVDPEKPSINPYSGGPIELVSETPQLHSELRSAAPEARASVFGRNGVWYEMLAEISERIAEEPGNAILRDERAALLEQVNLADVADNVRSRSAVPAAPSPPSLAPPDPMKAPPDLP